jgi:hypothetical protein
VEAEVEDEIDPARLDLCGEGVWVFSFRTRSAVGVVPCKSKPNTSSGGQLPGAFDRSLTSHHTLHTLCRHLVYLRLRYLTCAYARAPSQGLDVCSLLSGFRLGRSTKQ